MHAYTHWCADPDICAHTVVIAQINGAPLNMHIWPFVSTGIFKLLKMSAFKIVTSGNIVTLDGHNIILEMADLPQWVGPVAHIAYDK